MLTVTTSLVTGFTFGIITSLLVQVSILRPLGLGYARGETSGRDRFLTIGPGDHLSASSWVLRSPWSRSSNESGRRLAGDEPLFPFFLSVGSIRSPVTI